MKNRLYIILALLAANDRLGAQPLHRTTLVKQAFLAETIRPLYRVWQSTFKFVRYHYGPYSEDIFDKLDMLIINGMVKVTALEKTGGKIEARYKVTSDGHRVLDNIGQTEMRNLAHDLVWALQAIGVEQAGTICKLVYQEAEFARIFAQHTADGISAETKISLPQITAAGNETFITLSVIEELSKDPYGESSGGRLPSCEIVRIYLTHLALKLTSDMPV